MLKEEDLKFMNEAIVEARKGFSEGGVPIGAVLVRDGVIIGRGHNRRVQDGDPIAHGEMDCLRIAGRQSSYKDMTLYTTLSPCLMCAGTIVQFGILKVVIGENETFGGNEDFLNSHGVEIEILNNQECKKLMSEFIEKNPEIWFEDIGKEK